MNTADVTDMNYMFAYCTALTTLPQMDTANVESMNAMFTGCTSLTTVPQLNTSNATSMFSVFSGCTSLTTVPVLDTSSATSMMNMFKNCTSLPATFPWTINAAACTNMQDIFTGSSVTEVTIGNALAELKAQPATYFKADGNITVTFV